MSNACCRWQPESEFDWLAHQTSPMHAAARANCNFCVQRLLECGNGGACNVAPTVMLNSRDGGDLTPLHIAANFAQFTMVDLMLSSGAKADVLNVQHRTPLHYAVLNRHVDAHTLVHMLLRAAPTAFDVRALNRTADLHDLIREFEARNPEYSIQKHPGETPLEVAIATSSAATINILFDFRVGYLHRPFKLPSRCELFLGKPETSVSEKDEGHIPDDQLCRLIAFRAELCGHCHGPSLQLQMCFEHIVRPEVLPYEVAEFVASCYCKCFDVPTSAAAEEAVCLMVEGISQRYKDHQKKKSGCFLA